MAHIDSLQSGVFTYFSYLAAPVSPSLGASEVVTLFAATEPVSVSGIREFPEFSTVPAEVVQIPVYGQGSSVQTSAQADQLALDFTINYIPAEHSALASLAGDGRAYAFQILLASGACLSKTQSGASGLGVGTARNTVFNFIGKFVGFSVAPSLSDSLTASVIVMLESEVFGPFTYGGGGGATLPEWIDTLQWDDNLIWND